MLSRDEDGAMIALGHPGPLCGVSSRRIPGNEKAITEIKKTGPDRAGSRSVTDSTQLVHVRGIAPTELVAAEGN